eukprot:2715284-Amphidinium_carterae.1
MHIKITACMPRPFRSLDKAAIALPNHVPRRIAIVSPMLKPSDFLSKPSQGPSLRTSPSMRCRSLHLSLDGEVRVLLATSLLQISRRSGKREKGQLPRRLHPDKRISTAERQGACKRNIENIKNKQGSKQEESNEEKGMRLSWPFP